MNILDTIPETTASEDRHPENGYNHYGEIADSTTAFLLIDGDLQEQTPDGFVSTTRQWEVSGSHINVQGFKINSTPDEWGVWDLEAE